MVHDKLTPPEKTTGDAAHSVAKAVISGVPIIGGPASELFQQVVQPPLEKRRERWMEDVGQRLYDLANTGLDLEQLQSDERFISTVMHASHLALRTHQKEKLTAFRNVITNVAKGQSPEETVEFIFLNLIDSLSVLHLQILQLFQAPTAPPNMTMGGLSNVLERNIPKLAGRRELYDQLWADLYSRGLVSTRNLHTTMSGSGLREKRTTGLGDQFLAFISEE